MSQSRISRLFVDQPLKPGGLTTLDERGTHYLKHVLRLKDGDKVRLFNGSEDQEFLSELRFKGKSAQAAIIDSITGNTRSKRNIHLLQAIGKPETMDFIFQKGTELGVTRIIVFNSERTQTPLKSARLDKKLEHWHRIAISACEQSGRNLLPEIDFYDSPQQAVERYSHGSGLLLDFAGESINEACGSVAEGDDICLMIGPEGGFNSHEVEQARKHGYRAVLAGPRTLRMETAAIATLAMVQFRFGDMG